MWTEYLPEHTHTHPHKVKTKIKRKAETKANDGKEMNCEGWKKKKKKKVNQLQRKQKSIECDHKNGFIRATWNVTISIIMRWWCHPFYFHFGAFLEMVFESFISKMRLRNSKFYLYEIVVLLEDQHSVATIPTSCSFT